MELCASVWEAGVSNEQLLRQIFATDAQGFSEEELIYPVHSGSVTVRLKPTSSIVLIAEEAVSVRGAGESLEEKRRCFVSEEMPSEEIPEDSREEEFLEYTAKAETAHGTWQEIEDDPEIPYKIRQEEDERSHAAKEEAAAADEISFQRQRDGQRNGEERGHWNGHFPWKKPPHRS